MLIAYHGFEINPVQFFVTQEGATDDDGIPEVGALLPGFKQRSAPKAHSGTKSGSHPGLLTGGALYSSLQRSQYYWGEHILASSVANTTGVPTHGVVDRSNKVNCRNVVLRCTVFQRDTADTTDLIMERPRDERGRSRRSSSTGRHNSGRQRRLQLTSSDVQVMVEQEAESVARELAGEPSLSLLALADARKEMDDVAMKAQVRFVQPLARFFSDCRCSPRF